MCLFVRWFLTIVFLLVLVLDPNLTILQPLRLPLGGTAVGMQPLLSWSIPATLLRDPMTWARDFRAADTDWVEVDTERVDLWVSVPKPKEEIRV